MEIWFTINSEHVDAGRFRVARKDHRCMVHAERRICDDRLIPKGTQYVESNEGADPFHPDRFHLACARTEGFEFEVVS